MYCHVLVGVVFYIVLICKQSFGTDVTKLIDRLNATLSFPGWTRIANVAAKYQFPVNGNESFTGKDIRGKVFVSNNGFGDSENAVINPLVGEDNENVKHYMVTHLLGCVYANAMLKFMDLVRAILEEGNRARSNLGKLQLYHQKKKKLKDAEDKNPVDESLEGGGGKSNNSEGRPTKGDIIIEETSWEIFNFALYQLVTSSSMFDRMFSTMKCLFETSPSGESFDENIREMLDTLVMPCLRIFKDASKNTNLVLPTKNGEILPDYKNNVRKLSYHLTCFLAGQVKSSLRPFLNDHCTVSEEASPSAKTIINLFKEENKRKPEYTDITFQFGVRIEQLVLEVCNNYHSELGFEYNDRDKKTSFPRPLPQITDTIDKIENSQNIDN